MIVQLLSGAASYAPDEGGADVIEQVVPGDRDQLNDRACQILHTEALIAERSGMS